MKDTVINYRQTFVTMYYILQHFIDFVTEIFFYNLIVRRAQYDMGQNY